MCFAHGVGASVAAAMCSLQGCVASMNDNTAVRMLVCDVSIFGRRTKWVEKNVETAPFDIVLCTRGRGERVDRSVLDTVCVESKHSVIALVANSPHQQ